MALNGNVARFSLPSGFMRFSANASMGPDVSVLTHPHTTTSTNAALSPLNSSDAAERRSLSRSGDNVADATVSPPSSPFRQAAPHDKPSPLRILQRIEMIEHSIETLELNGSDAGAASIKDSAEITRHTSKMRGRITEEQLKAVMPRCATKRAAIWSVPDPLDGKTKNFMEALARAVSTLDNHEHMVSTHASPLPPITALPYIGSAVMRASYNFLAAYYYATHASPAANTQNGFAALSGVLCISLGNAADALCDELARLVPSCSLGHSALMVAVCLGYHIFPNALLTGKSRTVAAIVELFSDLAAIMVLARDENTARLISQWLPSLEHTGVVVCEALLGHQHSLAALNIEGALGESGLVDRSPDRAADDRSPLLVPSTQTPLASPMLQYSALVSGKSARDKQESTLVTGVRRLAAFELGLHRAAVVSGITPAHYSARCFDGGVDMTLDPLETTLNISRFLASKTRAPLSWPPIATVKSSAANWYGGGSQCIDVPNDRAPILTKENVRHAPVGPDGNPLDASDSKKLKGPEFTALAHRTTRKVVKSATSLMTKMENRKLLPLCAVSTLRHAEKTGVLHNEDRWWLTDFVLDAMGSEPDVLDIEDLVLGFQSACRNFPQKHAAHVRSHAVIHYPKTQKNVAKKVPEFVLSNCKAMKTSYFAKSSRRGSACPYAGVNSGTMGRNEVKKLLEWQLGEDPATALGTTDLNAILDGVDNHNPDAGCLAHYNAMLRKRLGARTHEREKKITFPAQFTQFQCLHSKPN